MLIKERLEIIDYANTIIEYKNIINEYKKTGKLVRDDAINKYKNFIAKNPEYYSVLFNGALIGEQLVQLTNSNDNVLINNLNSQLNYLEIKTAGKTIEEIIKILQKK